MDIFVCPTNKKKIYQQHKYKIGDKQVNKKQQQTSTKQKFKENTQTTTNQRCLPFQRFRERESIRLFILRYKKQVKADHE